MSYVRPVVQVYQEYEAYSTASQSTKLVPCIIGPCYHVMDADTDTILARLGILTTEGLGKAAIPNNKNGAIVEETSLVIRYKQPKILLVEDAVSSGISAYKVSFTPENFPHVVTEDCVVTVKDGDTILAAEARVISVDLVNHRLGIDKAIFNSSASLKVDVYYPLPVDIYATKESGAFAFEDGTNPLRNEAGVLLVDGLGHSISIGTSSGYGIAIYDDDQQTIIVNPLEAIINEVACPITSATVYIGYKALRTDLKDVNIIASYDDLVSELGACTPSNPLGFGVALAFANTAKVPIKCIGVETDDIQGYSDALSAVSHEENVYAIVPLTQDPGIISMFGTHAYEMSTPEQGRWRVCIANTELPVRRDVSDVMAEVMVNPDDDDSRTLIRAEEGNFLEEGVNSAYKVEIYYSTAVKKEYTVKNVLTKDLLELTTEVDEMFLTNGTEYPIIIYQDISDSKDAQAAYIAEVSTSYGSSRVINVWPDICVIDKKDLPGYYLGCVLAGMIGGLPSHQGFTRMSVAGVTGLKHAGTYFSAEQLDIIAAGGTCVFNQTNPLAVPTIRHQLTTDMSTIEFREISFVKNFDYVSYLSKELLDQYIGKYNITPITLVMLGDALTSLYESLRLSTLPKIGAPILSYSIESIKQVETNRGRVEIIVKILFPYALNEIGLHLVSI